MKKIGAGVDEIVIIRYLWGRGTTLEQIRRRGRRRMIKGSATNVSTLVVEKEEVVIYFSIQVLVNIRVGLVARGHYSHGTAI